MFLLKKILRFFEVGVWKTLYINITMFPLNQAINFPFIVSRRTKLAYLKGDIIFVNKPKMGQVKFGFGEVGIFDRSRSRSILSIKEGGKLIVRGSVNIGHGSKISINSDGELTLGDDFKITAESKIICNHKIEIGRGFLCSWDVLIMDTDFHKIYHNGDWINRDNAVKIGDDVWVGCQCLILKGSVIPNNCVIGARSLITKSLRVEGRVYSGNNGQMIKEFSNWIR